MVIETLLFQVFVAIKVWVLPETTVAPLLVTKLPVTIDPEYAGITANTQVTFTHTGGFHVQLALQPGVVGSHCSAPFTVPSQHEAQVKTTV